MLCRLETSWKMRQFMRKNIMQTNTFLINFVYKERLFQIKIELSAYQDYLIIIQVQIKNFCRHINLQNLYIMLNLEENKLSQDSIKDIESLEVQQIDTLIDQKSGYHQVDTPAFQIDSQENRVDILNSKRRGRKSIYEGAEHPELIDRAKLILPMTNYDIDQLLELEEFKILRNSKDLPRFISKFILNKTSKNHSKSMKAKSLKGFDSPHRVAIDYSQMGHHVPKNQQGSKDVLNAQSSLTPQANYGAKIQSEITSNYLRQYMLLKPQERYEFLEKICERNSQSLLEFLINLKTTCSSNFYDGMFGLIHELNLSSKVDLQIKTRLFVNEIIKIDEDLLKNSMTLLAQRPNSEQTLGLANYIFINEVEEFSKLQEELVLLDSKNIGIIPLMGGTFAQFKIDPQVIRLLPNTLQCLNKPFIQILKQDHGLRLIREIPINVVGDFLQICALSQSKNYHDLDKMISHISDIFIKKWDYLDQTDFSLLIAQFSVELKERNQNWIGRHQEIMKVVEQIAFIQLEKGIKSRPDIIADLISGNSSSLHTLLKNPKKIDDLTGQQFYKMVGKFKKMNKNNDQVYQYCCHLQENQTSKQQQLQRLEDILGFQFLALQKFCINFALWGCRPYQFLNFGIGNGKTLLCASIAVLLTLERQKSTIILGKNDYLVLRDEK